MPLTYHAGQIAAQDEANTRPIAATLANWSVSIVDFTLGADLILLATAPADGDLNFVSIAGSCPLVQFAAPDAVLLPELPLSLGAGVRTGGIAISLAERRRARLNGTLLPADDGESALLHTSETFMNCRKYIAPSVPLSSRQHVGPTFAEALAYDDPWLANVVASAETSFLASMSPEGLPDVSHKGGPAGFLKLDAAAGTLRWFELIGNGMFKSAGNVRATGKVTLLVLDLAMGDAAELGGIGRYETLHTFKEARDKGLVQNKDPFPVQGEIVVQLTSARRLVSFTTPRDRQTGEAKIDCSSPAEDQRPQFAR